MTSERSMFFRAARLMSGLGFGVTLALGFAGCVGKPPTLALVEPVVLQSPYDARQGDVLLGVVPPSNESGTTSVDTLALGDQLAAAITEARGLRALPINRTVAAMQAEGIDAVRSPADVRLLADALGVDGLIVGTVTAWDPYRPAIGLNLAIYARGQALRFGDASGLDTRALTQRPTDTTFLTDPALSGKPASVVSEHLSGENHLIQAAVRTYATGRHDDRAALGWRRYLKSMGLFTQFATSYAVGRLIDEEADRLARVEASVAR